MTDPFWYKDAVIYQLHVKSFFDSNGDVIGDFPGLTSRLDYIASLGVNTIWLLPFYPSPRRDDGCDIADYRGIHPDYGTMRDFRRILAAGGELVIVGFEAILHARSPNGAHTATRRGTSPPCC
jgi:maltose alpha-D-glucosyltransferase/alpha-amylase